MKQLICIIGLGVIVGCSQQKTEPITLSDIETIRETEVAATEYPEWVEANTSLLSREQVIGDLTYRFTRIPAELLVVREAGLTATTAQLLEARQHYSELVYFRLEIIAANHNGELLKKDLQSEMEYNRRVTYSAFGIQKDIALETGNDNIPCAMCQFERSFDVAPVSTFLLAFDITEDQANKSGVTLILNDQLFNNGIIRFAWNAGEINAYPSLKGINQ